MGHRIPPELRYLFRQTWPVWTCNANYSSHVCTLTKCGIITLRTVVDVYSVQRLKRDTRTALWPAHFVLSTEMHWVMTGGPN